VDIGIAFLGDDHVSELLTWARSLDLDARIATIWTADERFLRDPWVQLGALAATTSRVRIGVCVTDPFIRHPALTAAAAATLDELSGGRAVLGLGAGSTGFSALGLSPQHVARSSRECIELCRRLWSETRPFTYEGQEITFINDRLDIAPSRLIPIYVAARGPMMLELAAALGDAVLIGNFVQGRGLEYAMGHVREGERRRSASLGRLRKAAWIYFSVGDDAEAARLAASRGLALALWSSHRLLREIGYSLPGDVLTILESSAHGIRGAALERLVRVLPDELVDDFTVSGDVPNCVAKLRHLLERGIDEIVVLPFAPEGHEKADVIDRLVSQVAAAISAPAMGP
jgi:5,10-methylenetetrahydromethanopterin reductase